MRRVFAGLALAVSTAALTAPVPTVAHAATRPVIVVSYNLAGAMPKPLAAGSVHPFTDTVADYLASVGADVVGLQEVCYPQAVAIGAQLGPAYRIVFTRSTHAGRCDDYLSKKQRKKYGDWAGTAIIVRTPSVTDVQVTALPWESDPAGTPGRQPRTLTCLTADIGGPLSVCNTHLSPSPGPNRDYTGPGVGVAIRQQAPMVNAEEQRRAAGRMVAVGDHNANPDLLPDVYATLTQGLTNADGLPGELNKLRTDRTIDFHFTGGRVVQPLVADRQVTVSDHVPTRSVINPDPDASDPGPTVAPEPGDNPGPVTPEAVEQ